jgi:hypothetical protein
MTSLPAGTGTGIDLPGGRARIVVVEGRRRLAVPATTDGFEGRLVRADDGALRLVELTTTAAARVRELVPALRPRPLAGGRCSFGFGDRLGLATPGHVRALRGRDGPPAPVLAQQSARELHRTRRTFVDVLDAATWGVLEAGWTYGYGADADHLRAVPDVEAAVAAGFTMLTLDPSAHVDAVAAELDGAELARRVEALPWTELEDDWASLRRRYEGQPDADLQLARTAATYGRALAHLVTLARAVEATTPEPLDVEVSVDETPAATTLFAHRFLATELNRLGVRFTGLAPRFPGVWRKGVDVSGDLGEIARAAAAHARVAAEGGYTVSVHSGSDKLSVFPSLAAAGGSWHVKTSGTSYLEALRVVARTDPALFRDVLALARRSLAEDRLSYEIAASAGVPEPPLGDAVLPGLLDDPDVRQCLHVTYGSVLTDDDVAQRLHARLVERAGAYEDALASHFDRHLDALGALA